MRTRGQLPLRRPRRRRARLCPSVERRWWAATAPSPPVSAGLFLSVIAFTLTARDGVTPTSRTGFENVSGSPRPWARSLSPLPRACFPLPRARGHGGCEGRRGCRAAAGLPAGKRPRRRLRAPGAAPASGAPHDSLHFGGTIFPVLSSPKHLACECTLVCVMI